MKKDVNKLEKKKQKEIKKDTKKEIKKEIEIKGKKSKDNKGEKVPIIDKMKKAANDTDAEEKNVNIRFTIIALLCIVLFSAALVPFTLQNDTFYTIKIGEHIVNTGKIDMMDPFSWHENLSYTYPHWLYDVMIYGIYCLGGFLGIYISTVIFSCLLGVSLFFVNKKISENDLVSFLVTMGAMYILEDFIAARAQLVTFIILVLTILFIENFLEKKKFIYLIGIVINSILIVNMHCAIWPFFFVIFLPYIAEYLIYAYIDKQPFKKILLKIRTKKLEKYKNKLSSINNEEQEKIEKYREKIKRYTEKIDNTKNKIQKNIKYREEKRKKPYRIKFYKNKEALWLIVIMIICALTGLLSPIGDTPYTYLYKTLKGNTTDNISEHLPLTLINNDNMVFVLTGFILLFLFTDTKIRTKDLFFLGGLVFLMFRSRRQESMFVLFCSGVLARLVADIFYKYDFGGSMRIKRIMVSTLGNFATVLFVILLSLYVFKDNIGTQFVDSKSYPVEMAEYIKENVDLETAHIYNEYNYGSYLLYEDIPVFIDSRADLYAPEFSGKEEDIFSDFINCANIGTYYEKIFEKYDFSHILMYKNAKVNMFVSRDPNYELMATKGNFVLYRRLNCKYINETNEIDKSTVLDND